MPHAVDVHVGERIRLRRTMLGISQNQLAQHLGISFQQVQKYENAGNRVSASRLHAIAKALELPVTFFFAGYDDPAAEAEAAADDLSDPLFSTESLRFLTALHRLSPVQKDWLIGFLDTLPRSHPSG